LERLGHAFQFLTKHMREVGGKPYFEALMAAFDKHKNEHIAVYGPDTTCASPVCTRRNPSTNSTMALPTAAHPSVCRTVSSMLGYKGYLEDRRPNSQGDPYKIASRILQTIATVPTK